MWGVASCQRRSLQSRIFWRLLRSVGVGGTSHSTSFKWDATGGSESERKSVLGVKKKNRPNSASPPSFQVVGTMRTCIFWVYWFSNYTQRKLMHQRALSLLLRSLRHSLVILSIFVVHFYQQIMSYFIFYKTVFSSHDANDNQPVYVIKMSPCLFSS